MSEWHFFNLIEATVEDNLARIDDLGGPSTYNHYPIGWAQAGNTPFQWYKRWVHAGGVRDPLIVHWPARIRDGGAIRNQYHHVVDIVPTVLEAIGVEAPDVVNGVPQLPIEGTSFGYTFTDARRADPQGSAVLRDVRQPGHLGRRLEGGGRAPARRPLGVPAAVRGRPLGAVPPRRRLLRARRPRRPASREGAGAHRALVVGGREAQRAPARRPRRRPRPAAPDSRRCSPTTRACRASIRSWPRAPWAAATPSPPRSTAPTRHTKACCSRSAAASRGGPSTCSTTGSSTSTTTWGSSVT